MKHMYCNTQVKDNEGKPSFCPTCGKYVSAKEVVEDEFELPPAKVMDIVGKAEKVEDKE